MMLIGVSGTNGSGKDTLSRILADDYGWLFISSSEDLIIPELQRLGRPVDRAHMSGLSTEWRKQIGMSAVVVKAIEKYNAENKSKKYRGLVISSLRHPGEADEIHKQAGVVVWVDADPEIRYGRIYKRGQGSKDQKTYKQFLAEEQAEMNHSGDDATLNMAGVKAKADVFITNATNDIESFKQTAKKALNL